jgi:hypothetical protein
MPVIAKRVEDPTTLAPHVIFELLGNSWQIMQVINLTHSVWGCFALRFDCALLRSAREARNDEIEKIT